MAMKTLGSLALAAGAAMVAAGAQAQIAPGSDNTILVMTPKVEVVFVTTGGSEPRADWTETATTNLMAEMTAELERSGETLIRYEPTADAEANDRLTQLMLLNEAVLQTQAGTTNLNTGKINGVLLPHRKNEDASYSLGPDVATLAQGYEGADYALFLNSYSQIESGGLFLAKVAIGAATGYVPVTANLRGHYVALVDLETGEHVWTGSAFGSDPRQPNEAKSVISGIFKKSPLR